MSLPPTFVMASAMAFLATYLAARLTIAAAGLDRLRKMSTFLRGRGRRYTVARKPRALGARDRQRLEEQLESVVVLIGGAMASGQNVIQAIESCVTEITERPLGPELRRAVDEYRVGSPIITALWSMAARLGHADVGYFVRVVEVQLLSGGEFSGALESVANTIRARRSLRGEIRSGCAEARLSVVIMAALPPCLSVFAMAFRPEMFEVMTGTGAGRAGLAYGMVSWMVGMYVCHLISVVRDA